MLNSTAGHREALSLNKVVSSPPSFLVQRGQIRLCDVQNAMDYCQRDSPHHLMFNQSAYKILM